MQLQYTCDQLYAFDLTNLKEIWAWIIDSRIQALRDGEQVLKLPAFDKKNYLFDRKRLIHMVPELFIQVKGRTIFDLPNEEVMVDPGEVFLVPSRMPHFERPVAFLDGFCTLFVGFGQEKISLHFGKIDEDGIPRPGSEWGVFEAEECQDIWRGFEAAVKSADGLETKYNANREAMIMLLSYIKQKIASPPKFTYTNACPLIVKCTELIVEMYQDNTLNVKKLAQKCGVSPNHLSSEFKKEVGIKLTQYINGVRLYKVEQLLKETPLPISEIAWAAGYNDHNYLIRVFKAKHNMTPREYRKREREL